MRRLLFAAALLAGGAAVAAEPAMPAAAHADHHPSPAADPSEEPPPPTDHAADRVYGRAAMEPSRARVHAEHGGDRYTKVMINLAEYAAVRGHDGYRWEGEAWYGGDIDRAVIKSEGEGVVGGEVEDAEVQALYSHAIGPYFDLQAGLRQDLGPGPARTYAAVGFEGLAPYWFELEGAAFLSQKGEVLARFTASYDQLITQRLALQPRVEVNLAAQSTPATGVGAGLSEIEAGLRLRYEITRQFAPYIGVSFSGKAGKTADYARTAGERVSGVGAVIGLRAWF